MSLYNGPNGLSIAGDWDPDGDWELNELKAPIERDKQTAMTAQQSHDLFVASQAELYGWDGK